MRRGIRTTDCTPSSTAARSRRESSPLPTTKRNGAPSCRPTGAGDWCWMFFPISLSSRPNCWATPPSGTTGILQRAPRTTRRTSNRSLCITKTATSPLRITATSRMPASCASPSATRGPCSRRPAIRNWSSISSHKAGEASRSTRSGTHSANWKGRFRSLSLRTKASSPFATRADFVRCRWGA